MGMARSRDDLVTSQSIEGKSLPDFEMLGNLLKPLFLLLFAT